MSSNTNNTLCPICYINKPTIGCTTCKYILCKECSDKLQKNECPGCRNSKQNWRKSLQTNLTIDIEAPVRIDVVGQPVQLFNQPSDQPSIIQTTPPTFRITVYDNTRVVRRYNPHAEEEAAEQRLYLQEKCMEYIKCFGKSLFGIIIAFILGFITTLCFWQDFDKVLLNDTFTVLFILGMRGAMCMLLGMIIFLLCAMCVAGFTNLGGGNR